MCSPAYTHKQLTLTLAAVTHLLSSAQDMPTGKDFEGISDTAEWSALEEHVKDINAT